MCGKLDCLTAIEILYQGGFKLHEQQSNILTWDKKEAVIYSYQT